MRLSIPFSLALACAAVPAAAQTAPTPAPAPVADPARNAAAQVTVDHLFPTGTYKRIMQGSLDMVMGNMMDSVGQMPLRSLAASTGMAETELSKVGEGTLAEVMKILDPAFDQRTRLGMQAVMAEMTDLVTEVEPAFRDGLRQAYARRFTAAQLGDMNRFFATPTGRDYAAESMVIFMSPEVMAKMQEIMPLMMKRMPDMMKKIGTATASLPKPRQPEDLSATERRRLATLLGVSEASLMRKAD